jgi:hypothetical protein
MATPCIEHGPYHADPLGDRAARRRIEWSFLRERANDARRPPRGYRPVHRARSR